jgi:hypothetical protein
MEINGTTSGIQKSMTIGGRVFTEAEVSRFESGGTTGIILYSSNATGGRGTSFRKADGTAYQVGVGKTLTFKAAKLGNAGGTGLASYKVIFGYSDAAVNFDTASPGTNPIYFGSGTSSGNVATGVLNEKYSEMVLDWQVPASKYPFYTSVAGGEGWAQVFCFID